MNRLLFPRLVCLAALAGLGFVPGCGKKLPSLAPVSGKVTVDGEPLTSGQVTLVPDVGIPTKEGSEGQGETQTAGLSTAQIDSSGAYTISTNGKSGAPLGKYKVTVSPSMVPTPGGKGGPKTSYNRRYSNERETTLRIEVVANPTAGKYDLKLTK